MALCQPRECVQLASPDQTRFAMEDRDSSDGARESPESLGRIQLKCLFVIRLRGEPDGDSGVSRDRFEATQLRKTRRNVTAGSICPSGSGPGSTSPVSY